MEILTLIRRNSVGNARVHEKVQKKMVKGTSKSFSKVRVILTHELKEKGETAVKWLFSRVLKLNMSDCGACFGTSLHPQPH